MVLVVLGILNARVLVLCDMFVVRSDWFHGSFLWFLIGGVFQALF